MFVAPALALLLINDLADSSALLPMLAVPSHYNLGAKRLALTIAHCVSGTMATNWYLLQLGLSVAKGVIGSLDDCGALQDSHITNSRAARGLACSSMCHEAKVGNPHFTGTEVARILRSRLSAWALKTGALLCCFLDCTCVSPH